MDNLQAFKSFISRPRTAVIVTHFKPDADALGSSLGLAGFLKKKGHNVQVITPSDYPEFLAWMPGNKDVLPLSNNSKEPEIKAAKLIAAADVIFCLDFSSLKRINVLGDFVKNSDATKVLIDHHLEPESFADFEQWNPTAASTAGLVYELIQDLNEEHLITSEIANCLYAGLMTDTGGFRHNNTTQKEFLIASELVGLGANPSEVARQIYDANSLERLRLTGFVLSEKLQTLPEFRTAYIALSEQDLKKFESQTGDTEGLVNYGLSITGIRMAVLMYDRKGEIKMSFRSVGDFSVNEFARKHFQGGGHKNAAGGVSYLTLDETLKKFLALLPEYQQQLNSTL
jgi:bifunctional oligoribonuclease and PAP phosphatase NrnA